MKKSAFLTLLVIALTFPAARATHIVGGELTYECLDPNIFLYKITMKLYRSCIPGTPHAGYDSIIYIGVYHSDSLRWPTLPNGINSPFPSNFITLPNETYNLCLFSPPTVCVEEAIFSRNVILPPRPGGYILLYQRCCRNAAIVNIAGPLNTGAHWSVVIPDTSIGACNSDPVYNLYPPTIICANKPLNFDHSASDKDGDSLVYWLCPAFDGAPPFPNAAPPPPPVLPAYGMVDYINPPFYWDNPLGGPDSLKIHPTTGLLTGTASILGQFVVAVCVDEFRDGNYLSTNRRDFQFNVAQCDSVVYPNFTGVVEPCADDYSMQFTYTGLNGALFFWNFGDPSTLADTSLEKNPVYIYPDTGTYTVTVIVNRGFSCEKTFTKTITIPEYKVNADFGFTSLCANSPVIFRDSSSSPSLTISSWFWNFGDGNTSTQQHPSHTFYINNTYNVSLVVTSGSCTDTIVKQVTFEPTPLVTASKDTAIQLGDVATLSATGSSGTPPYIFTWAPPTSPSTGTPVIAAPTTTTTYRVTVTDSIGCYNTDLVVVRLLSDLNIKVPSAFTPNGDGRNDVFLAYDEFDGIGIKEIEFKVFNRWGEVVYLAESTDQALIAGWDGIHRKSGKECEIGVYVWLLKVTKLDGNEIEPMYGNVSLIR